MSTYYVKVKGTAIATSSRVQVGSDNTNYAGWNKSDLMIYCVAIGQDTRDPAAAVLKLQWKVSDGSFADLGSTGALKYTTSTNLTNDNAVTSGEALVSVASMTWQDGYEVEDGVAPSINLGSDYYSELQFAIDPSGATNGSTYEFQLYNTTLGAACLYETVTACMTVKMADIPTLTTSDCSDVTYNSATGNGNITATGDIAPTRRGFCYMAGTGGDPTTANSVAYDDGTWSTGAYTKSITGLSESSSYRVRAYATNTVGTGYGTTVQLTTPASVNYVVVYNNHFKQQGIM